MSAIRQVAKELLDRIPDEKLSTAIEVLEQIAAEGTLEGWRLWSEIGNDAAEGKWEDASEQHDQYLYGSKE